MPNDAPDFFEHRFAVPPEADGHRLDHCMASRYVRFTRSEWQDRIRIGDVQLDGARVKPARRVKAGQVILFRFEKPPEPPVNSDYQIIYGLDPADDLLAVLKPADLPVHPSGIYFQNTLTSLLKRDYPAITWRLINRIDRETSGLVLFSRTRELAREMQKLFLAQQVLKEYLVLVQGLFPKSRTARGWIGRKKESRVRKKIYFTARDQEADSWVYRRSAHTDFTVLKHFTHPTENKQYSLLLARLHTGRIHQIRATLSSLGFPVVGDRLYGVDEELYIKLIEKRREQSDYALLGMQRSALHCYRLAFEHPQHATALNLQAELPADMRAFMQTLHPLRS
ncbi:MAG: RluA family pseudouridine synthase [Leptospiraceae bacterium]|nr:RluA family pseudouridine synthase [Leptospiraceae bacterium]